MCRAQRGVEDDADARRRPGRQHPPSGTRIVWSDTVAATRRPSTLTRSSAMRPSLAATVFSSSRSIGAVVVLVTVAVESRRSARSPYRTAMSTS